MAKSPCRGGRQQGGELGRLGKKGGLGVRGGRGAGGEQGGLGMAARRPERGLNGQQVPM